MGADIYSCLIVGERIKKIKKTIEKTQYDSETGKPYKKMIEESEWRFITVESGSGSLLDFNDVPIYVFNGFIYVFDDFIYDNGSEQESENGIYGILVYKTESKRLGNEFLMIDVDKIGEAIKKYEITHLRTPGCFLTTEVS